MIIQYANAVAGAIPPASWYLPGVLTAVDGGYIVVKPNGTSLSVQPDGSYQERPAGTAGAWEVCQIDGGINVLRFRPDVGGTVIPYQVWFRAA